MYSKNLHNYILYVILLMDIYDRSFGNLRIIIMTMGMGMEMWGGSAGKPYLGMVQQMKLSPRVEEPTEGSDFTRFLLFNGRTVQNRKGSENDEQQRSQAGSAP